MSKDEMNDRSALVYIRRNPAFQENMIKIGWFAKKLKERMDQREHRTSGVPARFTCYYARKA